MKIFDLDKTSYLWNKLKNVLISKTDLINSVYPIGSIYISINNTSPRTFIGGTWERFAIGRTLVGVSENNTNFDTANKYGGEKEHALTIDEMPSHDHGSVTLVGSVSDVARQSTNMPVNGTGVFSQHTVESQVVRWYKTHNVGYDGFNCDASHEHEYVGEGKPHNNLQPYITCYIWRRIG